MAKRILLIEDEEKIARFTELELVHEGYEVVRLMTAGRAWRRLSVENMI